MKAIKPMQRQQSAVRWLCVLGLLLAFAGVAQAQRGPSYTGIDALFLVDQSGSMGGPDYGSSAVSTATDPFGLRFESLQYVVRTLAQYERLIPTGASIRMSVIAFGDVAETVLDWTLIEGSSSLWESREAELVQQVSAGVFGTRNLGNTNFLAAIDAAQNAFTQIETESDADSRLKLLIVLTDGAPCAPTDPDWSDPNCASVADQVEHMELLRDRTVSRFPPPNYQVHVVAIDEENRYWSTFSDDWQRVTGSAGSAQRIATSTDIGPAFLEIITQAVDLLRESVGDATTDPEAPRTDDGGLADIVGEPIGMTGNQGEVSVLPYYETLRLTFFKATPGATLTITQPDGAVLTPALQDVNVRGMDDTIEEWTIELPQPGIWRFETASSGSSVDAFFDLLAIDTQLSDVPPSPARYAPFSLTLSLMTSAGEPLPTYTDPQYALDVTATLRQPSGADEIIPLTLGGPGVYTGEVRPTQAGDYSVSLTASSNTPRRRRFTVVDAQSFATFSVAPTSLEVAGFPESDLLTGDVIRLSARLMASGGTSVQAEGVRVGAQVLDQVGTPYAQFPLELAPAGAAAGTTTSGSYNGTITMRDAGQYRIEVNATLENPDGSTTPITTASSGLFNVDPAALLVGDVLAPEANEQQFSSVNMGGIPHPFSFTPTKTTVRVELRRLDTGRLVDLRETTTRRDALLLTVTRAEGDDAGATVVEAATFTYDPDVQEYISTLEALPEGRYNLLVRGNSDVELADATRFAEATLNPDPIPFERVTNPLYTTVVALYGLVAVLVLLLIVAFALRWWQRRQHPARGMLSVLLDDFETGQVNAVKQIPLDGLRSNYISKSGSWLGEAGRELGIKRVIIECRSAQDSQRKRINVTLIYDGKRRESRVLSPHSEWLLRTAPDQTRSYTLAKDFDAFDY